MLKRESFLFAAMRICATLFFLALRGPLGWCADNQLGIAIFQPCEHAVRAGMALSFTPEMKQ